MEQGKLMAVLNCQKGPQNVRCNLFVRGWNFARYLGKAFCVGKLCKKKGYREFDHSGTLKPN